MDDRSLTDTAERRPIFAIEEMSGAFRIGLLLATLLPWAIVLAFAIAGFARPGGMLDVSRVGAVMLAAAFLSTVFAVEMIYAQMLQNDRSIGERAHRWWSVAFVLAGPLALPVYWWAHVRGAPRARGARGKR